MLELNASKLRGVATSPVPWLRLRLVDVESTLPETSGSLWSHHEVYPGLWNYRLA